MPTQYTNYVLIHCPGDLVHFIKNIIDDYTNSRDYIAEFDKCIINKISKVLVHEKDLQFMLKNIETILQENWHAADMLKNIFFPDKSIKGILLRQLKDLRCESTIKRLLRENKYLKMSLSDQESKYERIIENLQLRHEEKIKTIVSEANVKSNRLSDQIYDLKQSIVQLTENMFILQEMAGKKERYIENLNSKVVFLTSMLKKRGMDPSINFTGDSTGSSAPSASL